MISLLFLFLFCVPLRPRSVLFIPSSCFILLFLTVLYPTSLLTMCHALSSCCIIVAPDTINNHVKTCHEEQKNLHFFAPEYGGRHPRNDTLCYLSCYGQIPELQSNSDDTYVKKRCKTICRTLLMLSTKVCGFLCLKGKLVLNMFPCLLFNIVQKTSQCNSKIY